MTKLLYVINHIDWFWSHRLPLAQAAQKQGYEVHVAVPEADEKLTQHGFTGHDMQAGLIRSIITLRRLIKQEKPRIIHAITIKYAFIAGLATLFIPDIKIVHTIAGLGYLFSGHNTKAKMLRLFVTPLLRIALCRHNIHLIFQNPDDMQIMIAQNLAAQERSHLIRGSGVDIDAFKPDTSSPAQPPIVLMHTRLVHDKGVAIFVEAARILKARGHHARMQIAGGLTDNPLAITQAQMEAMIADGAAEWLGRVSDMPALLATTTLIAYPSYYREGIPKVLLEAAACGKPIVTTDHAGCREAVQDRHNGLLVPVKNPLALANAIELVLKDQVALTAMGAASRALAETTFDVRLINQQTIAVYDA
jgi:glycosyltransferase involved in cell wall biosynthesis